MVTKEKYILTALPFFVRILLVLVLRTMVCYFIKLIAMTFLRVGYLLFSLDFAKSRV